MDSSKQESFINKTQQSILVLVLVLILTLILVFRNLFYQPTLLLKSFSKLSIDPEIAFTNNKPTFLEFYAEWCEVCKEMAPRVSEIKDAYEKDINFVFLNVDNPKWEKYMRNFNVNGIPQINLFDQNANLQVTFIGKQKEQSIKESLLNLNDDFQNNSQILNSEVSIIKENKNSQSSPRAHG